MKNSLYSFAFLLFPLLCTIQAQTVIVGAGVRNGDFNDDVDPTDQRTFEDTPFWENIAGAQTLVASRTNLVGTSGTRNGQISHAPAQLTGQSSGYTIEEGDSFSVSYEWRDGFNWNDLEDKVRIVLFVTDDDTLAGVRTTIGSTDSDLSTTNNGWEPVESNDFYQAAADDEGKVLFVAIDTFDTDGSGFARIDDFELSVGPLRFDPFVTVDSGDYAFGDLIHPEPTSSSARSVSFQNSGAVNDLVVGEASLSDDGGGIFSITAAPADGTVIPPGGTFEVEVTATGGGSFNDYAGEILIATEPVDQSQTLSISANISTGRESFDTGSMVLVDFDDGLDNGIHETSLRNGGFEDGVVGQSLVDTPVWTSAFSPEGDTISGTLNAMPATGLLHSQASGFVAGDPVLGERVQPTQTFELDDWTLQGGDTYDIEFSAAGGAGFDDQGLQVIVEVLDAEGALIGDPINGAGLPNRWSTMGFGFEADGSVYERFAFSTSPIQRDSPWIGNRARVRFLTQGARDAFINIDDVTITANFRRLSLNRGEFRITNLEVDPETQEVTLRFVDSGASSYIVESSSDLNFDQMNTIPLDGSEDRDSYPGEIEFFFEDAEITTDFHAWRVVEGN